MTRDQFALVRASLPNNPGVYLYYDKEEKLLYVGKAKNIRKRVASYFTNKHSFGAKLTLLVNQIHKIEYNIVNNERDALLLENNLIKERQPKYNVMLKDDKTYPYIVIKNEQMPRIFFTRRLIRDGSEYFGPYTSFHRTRAILDFIKGLYPIRTCSLRLSEENIAAEKFKVCLEYHIKNCLGPCAGHQTKIVYDNNIDSIRQILKGDLFTIRKQLIDAMQTSANNMEFEEAAEYKRKVNHIDVFRQKSMVVNPKFNNIDVLTIASDEKYAFVNYMHVSNGSITQVHTTEIKKRLEESDAELLELAYYNIHEQLKVHGNEILLQAPFQLNLPQEITVPKIGDKKKLVELSWKNAFIKLKDKRTSLEKQQRKRKQNPVLDILQKDLRLTASPMHIECFDNSNFQGAQPVASMVVFRNGKPFKSEYRRYNIKTVIGPDDFASMEEVVYRRYKRLLEEDQDLPQLIVIDGGKGQLSAAVKSLKLLGIEKQLTVIGIAKRLEEIFFPGDSLALHINKRSPSLKLLQRVRNEAHRFAIEFHRNKRDKATLKTELTEIKGIGEKTAEKLLKEFGSVKGVKKAGFEDWERAVGTRVAEKLTQFFKKA